MIQFRPIRSFPRSFVEKELIEEHSPYEALGAKNQRFVFCFVLFLLHGENMSEKAADTKESTDKRQ